MAVLLSSTVTIELLEQVATFAQAAPLARVASGDVRAPYLVRLRQWRLAGIVHVEHRALVCTIALLSDRDRSTQVQGRSSAWQCDTDRIALRFVLKPPMLVLVA